MATVNLSLKHMTSGTSTFTNLLSAGEGCLFMDGNVFYTGPETVPGGVLAFDNSNYKSRSPACIVTKIAVSYKFKRENRDAFGAVNPIKCEFKPELIKGYSGSGTGLTITSYEFLSSNWISEAIEVDPSTYVDRTNTLYSGSLNNVFGTNNLLGTDFQFSRDWHIMDVDAYLKNVVLTLTYTPRFYAYFYNENKGLIDKVGPVDYGSAPTPPSAPSKTGYSFNGWKGSSGTIYTGTLPTGSEYDVSFEAVYNINKYTVSANIEGGGGTVTNTGSYDYNSSVTLTASPNSGYKFIGWISKDSNGNEIIDSNNTKTITVPANNVTLTARFEPIYVSYDSIFSFRRWKDTGIGSGNLISISNLTDTGFTGNALTGDAYTSESRPLTYVEKGKKYILECDASGAIMELIVFHCNEKGVWTENSNGTGGGGFTYIGKNEKKVEFQTKTNYISIRCDVDGPNTSTNFSNFRIYPADKPYMSTSVPMEYRTDKTSFRHFIPTRQHYTFKNWNTKEDGSGKTYTSNSVFPTEHTILYSQWQINNYTLTVSADTGGTVTGGGTYQYNTNATLTATPNAYYRFLKWNDGNTSATRTVLVDGNKTYIATFEKVEYTITTNVQDDIGGSVNGGGAHKHGSSISLTAIPSTNYKFVKWTDGKTSNPRTITVSGNATYTAVFEKEKYTINFRSTEGTLPYIKTLEYGSSLGNLPTPTKEGHTFVGWIPCAPAKKLNNDVLGSCYYSGSTAYPLLQDYKYTDKFSIHIEAFMEDWMDIKNRQIISCTEMAGWGLGYNANANGHGFEIRDGSSYKGVDLKFGTEGAFENGAWYSFDIVFSNKKVQVYVNGVKKGEISITSSVTYNSGNSISIGAEPSSNLTAFSNYFKGIISNVFIANQDELLSFATTNTIVNEDIDYYPVWRLNTYNINWQNHNNTILETDKFVPYNTIPTYNGSTPIKNFDNNYHYVFSNEWTPSVYPVNKNQNYIATFNNRRHEYSITQIKKPECLIEGTNRHLCDCGYYYDVKVEATGHQSWSQVNYSWNDIASSCTAQRRCGDCGTIEAATGLITSDIETEETCTENGDTIYTATFPSVDWVPSTTKIIRGNRPALGHDYSIVTVVQPTKNTNGYTRHTCSRCGDFYDDTITYLVVFEYKTVEYGRQIVSADKGRVTITPEIPIEPNTAQWIYSFDGWYNSDGYEWAPETIIEKSTVYTAYHNREVQKYIVRWFNGDVLVEQDEDVPYGEVPKYNGETPTKESDLIGSYVFLGWSVNTQSGIAPEFGQTYFDIYAKFSIIKNEYTATWRNYDGTILETKTIYYGDSVGYTGKTPTRESTPEFEYTFTGWKNLSPEIDGVLTGDIIYEATFGETKRTYSITFYLYDMDNNNTEKVMDELITYGEILTIEAEKRGYHFVQWNDGNKENPRTVTILDTVSYTATMEKNEYTIDFIDETNPDDVYKKTLVLKYQSKIEAPNDEEYNKERHDTKQYNYTFENWKTKNEIEWVEGLQATEDIKFYATYSRVINQYRVEWKNYDGAILKEPEIVDYGTIIQHPEKPIKPYDELYHYNFIGWNEASTQIIDNTIYVAQFEAIPHNLLSIIIPPENEEKGYTKHSCSQCEYVYNDAFKWLVTFSNIDGQGKEETIEVFENQIPVCPTTPTKNGTIEFDYEFFGWEPEIEITEKAIKYTAIFTPIRRKYYVYFYSYLKEEELLKAELEYGEKLYDKLEIPVGPKRETVDKIWTFEGWVSETGKKLNENTKIEGELEIDFFDDKDYIFVADYSTIVRPYEVTWRNFDNKYIYSELVDYGTVPVYTDQYPKKERDDTYHYVFNDWNPKLAPVEGEITYIATFKEEEHFYKTANVAQTIDALRRGILYICLGENCDYEHSMIFLNEENHTHEPLEEKPEEDNLDKDLYIDDTLHINTEKTEAIGKGEQQY